MTAAQRATLEQLQLLLGVCDNWRLAETETGRDECGNCGGRLREHQQAAALRAAVGTCGSCAHLTDGLCLTDEPDHPSAQSGRPLAITRPEWFGCTGWTAKEGA